MSTRRPLAPPDPRPARLVGRVLAYDRRLGIDFATAWGDAMEWLDGLEPRDRSDWWQALAATRGAWAAAYGNDGERTALDRTLLD